MKILGFYANRQAIAVAQQQDWAKRFGFMLIASLTIPPILLWQAWKTSSWRYKHLLLTAFVTVYGATITIQYDPTGQGSDGVRHLRLVYDHYVGLGFQQFLVELWHTLTFQLSTHPGIRDPYKHIVSYLTGGLLGMPWLFFSVIAFVYGYFFTGSLLEVFRNFKFSKFNYVIIAFAALFFLLKNIEGVNTVRTWTGLWILVYACLKYYGTGKKRYLFLMLMPPFVHFGYFIMVIPALFVALFGNRPLVYSVLFVASSATNLIPQPTLMEMLATTERGAHQSRAYFLEQRRDYDEIARMFRAQGSRWWLVAQRYGLQKWALNILIYTVLLCGIYYSCMDFRQRSLFSTGLLSLALSNSTWFLYALSNRLWIIGAVFILAAIVLAFTSEASRAKIRSIRKPPYYAWGLNLSLVVFIPYFLFQLSVLIDYPSVLLVFAPFMVWLDPEINMSVKYAIQVLLGLR